MAARCAHRPDKLAKSFPNRICQLYLRKIASKARSRSAGNGGASRSERRP